MNEICEINNLTKNTLNTLLSGYNINYRILLLTFRICIEKHFYCSNVIYPKVKGHTMYILKKFFLIDVNIKRCTFIECPGFVIFVNYKTSKQLIFDLY